MTKQQNQEWAAKFGKLRSQSRAHQLGLPDEVRAVKDEPTNRHGGFNLDGVLCGPGPRVQGKAGKAALAAAFHDVVTEGEGIEPMGLWHGVAVPETGEGEPEERELTEGERKDRLAARSFDAMMHRVRQGGGLPLTVLEECLSSLLLVADHEVGAELIAENVAKKGGDTDIKMPASWFKYKFGIPAARLRSARKRGRIRAEKPGHFWQYSVADARSEWRDDGIYIPE